MKIIQASAEILYIHPDAVSFIERVARTCYKSEDRARGVVRVVRTWEKCFDGTTDRCPASRAIKAAQKLKAELMAEHPDLYS